jgi:hypothetical protein
MLNFELTQVAFSFKIYNSKFKIGFDEDRHPHTYHARHYAQLGAEIRVWRIYSPGAPQL